MIEKPWQACFEMGWLSFKNGSVPIGSVIVNDKGSIIAKGRNMIFDDKGENGQIMRHKLAHAEMNALLKANQFEYPDIRKFCLYTTTEPCPLCFGALVMANIRHVKFASRDGLAGSTDLNEKSNYISSKNINIEGPYPVMEKVQIAIQTVFELTKSANPDRVLRIFKNDNPEAVECGIKLFEDGTLKIMMEKDLPASEVFDIISSM